MSLAAPAPIRADVGVRGITSVTAEPGLTRRD
jgi:hypothetical protein